MTVLLIAVGSIGFAFGCVFGLILGAMHMELEVEQAYLFGHVDGHRKASDDAGEVPW